MEIIFDLTVIFSAAAIMLALMDRYNHPSIPGYIIAGLLAGTLISTDLLDLAQIGIAFLVFIFGLKYNPSNLRSAASATLNTTTLQMTVTGGLGFLLATLLGFTSMESFYFAVAAALSSSLVGLQLTEREIHTNLLHGRLSESIHFIQDMIAFGFIAVILATSVETALYALVYSALLIGSAILIRDYFFEFVAKQAGGNQELLTMASLTFLLGFIGLTEFLGISMVVGAFAAGLAVSKFPYNIELLDTMGSIKDFFSAIFFVILGVLVTIPNQTVLAAAIGLVLITSVAAPLTTYFSLKMFGYDNRTALLTGLSLGQVSELALILAIQGFMLELVTPVLFEAIILGATVSMVVSSYTKKYEEDIYQSLAPARNERASYSIEDHVIVVGHDVQGTKVAEALKQEDTEFVVIDNDPEKVSELKEKGVKAVYGDIMDDITWKEANYQEANLVVSTVPSEKVSNYILKRSEPEDKIVRAEDIEEALRLLENGALHAIVPDISASEKLLEHIEGISKNPERREELRRKSLLEFRRYLSE